MILAGIDEAGLGPTLGPLVTACSALETPGDWQPETPWKILSTAVAEKWERAGRRLTVADSKMIYRSGGIKALEVALGAFCRLLGLDAGPLPLAAPDSSDVAVHPCYQAMAWSFPVHMDADIINEWAGRLGVELAEAGAGVAGLGVAVVPEPVLNRRFDAGLNKNQALLMETGRHIVRLAREFADKAVMVVIDKQGGRNDYLPFLMSLFPGAWLDVLAVGAGESRYRMRRPGGDVVLVFKPKADADSFPTALASMAAKYVRERYVAVLNDWFVARIPGLRPTAGYYVDAQRWLRDVEAAGVDGLLVDLVTRSR